jgi:alkylation response protein AidB-like acyl-CoA dehydrogenase
MFTAFLVERSFAGVSSGPEEHKMGMSGSSTTAVYLDNVPVPLENVLGEIGRRHIIAFNILNIGRLKLGPGSLAAAKNMLAISLRYAKERKAFGCAIAEFGAIRHKLAEMAIRIYFSWLTKECRFMAATAITRIAVERAYRDARINRLFEGTNEINRLLITGMLLKRAARGGLSRVPAAQAILGAGRTHATEQADEQTRLVRKAKKVALLAIGAAYQKYGMDMQKQQEILMSVSDMLMEILAMESAVLRGRKLNALQKAQTHLI